MLEGDVICGLVQPPAPPQRDQIRNSCAATQWPRRGDLPPPRCRLRTGTSASSTTVVTIYTLLASTRGGLDQSTTHGNRTPTRYICHGCLISSRDVIFPDSYRPSVTLLRMFLIFIATQRRPRVFSLIQLYPSLSGSPCLRPPPVACPLWPPRMVDLWT